MRHLYSFILDRYFDNILNSTPDSVEDVMVEADGEWHTSDNKHHSPGWKAARQPIAPSPTKSPPKPVVHTPAAPHPRQSNVEIVVLDDSDDSDTEPASRSKGVSQSSEPRNGLAETVIDLTLSSDEDESPPPPPPRANGKRKEPDHTAGDSQNAWKKARVVDPPPAHPAAAQSRPAPQLNGASMPHQHLPLPYPLPGAAPYVPYAPYPPNPQGQPVNGIYLPGAIVRQQQRQQHPNGNGHWA